MDLLRYPIDGPGAVVLEFRHKKWLSILTYLQLVVSVSGYLAATVLCILQLFPEYHHRHHQFEFDMSGIWAGVPIVAGACVGVAAVRKSTWSLMMMYLAMSVLTCVSSLVVLGFAVNNAIYHGARFCSTAVLAYASCKLRYILQN